MRQRSGVAMLLVMMACTLLLVGVVIIARSRTTSLVIQQHGLWGVRANQLQEAAQDPIMHWLENESAGVVLGPDVLSPAIPILDDSFEIDGVLMRIRVTAWDQQGMWPRNAAELGLESPTESDLNYEDLPNLAQLQMSERVYPSAEHPQAFGSLVATHNPWPTRSGQTRSRGIAAINVNTAPLGLLDQIRSRYTEVDLGQLAQQRAEGQAVALGQTGRDAQGNEVRLIGVSRVWSFRTQVSVGQVSKGIWSVYVNQGGQWQLAQRTMINEPLD